VGVCDSPIGMARRYGGAEQMFENFGFTVECRHADYYAPGEDMAVMGLRLMAPPPGVEPPTEDERFVEVTDADEIDDTDEAYLIDWDYVEDGPGSDAEEIGRWVKKIAGWDGRLVLVGLPGHAGVAQGQFFEAGFREEGRLNDLIEDGVDEMRLRIDL
jgi:hypothetical protein